MIVTDSQGKPVMEMEGLYNTYRFVDVALRNGKIQVAHPVVSGQKMTVTQGTFMKCGYDISLEGSTIGSPTWDGIAKVLNKNLHPKARIQLREEEKGE